jgi:Holliday junction resolvase
VYYFFPATHGFGRSGVPDIVACVNGHFLAIECKAGKNKPTALQIREIENIRLAGGVAVVANEENWDMLASMVRKLKVSEWLQKSNAVLAKQDVSSFTTGGSTGGTLTGQ